jgi:serine/threonine-protein kinase
VLIARGGDAITRDRVHVTDLGLADLTGRTALMGDREVAGTPAYIAPEQVLGHAVDARADLYQAGALLYFLVTGLTPYPRSSSEKIIHAHLYAPPPVPSARVPATAPLDRLVTRALSKQPSARFQSALEFRAALEESWPAAGVPAIASHPIDATAVLPAATTPATYLPVDPLAATPGPYRRARSDSRLGIVAALVIAVLVLVPVLQTILPGAASATSAVSPSASLTSVTNGVVPLLTGTLQDAQAALVAQGFVTGEVTTKNSSEAEGRLLSQHPEPGSLSPRGSAVDMVVASGRNAVPQLAGLTVSAATVQLKTAGFVAASGQLSSGSVVGGTSPAGGQVVRVGSTVTLVAPTVTSAPATPSPSPTDAASAGTPTVTASASAAPSATTSATHTSSPSASGA